MKLSTLIAGVACVTAVSAWRINWYYTNGQVIESHGWNDSPCQNLNIENVPLDYYEVDWETPLRPDPDRVRVWTGRDCFGTPTWDSGKSGKNDLKPNRVVKSYIID